MKRVYLILGVTAILGLFLFIACEQNESDLDFSKLDAYSSNEINDALEDLSSLLVSSISDYNFRKEIKEIGLIEYRKDFTALASINLKNKKTENSIINLFKKSNIDKIDLENLYELVNKIPNYEIAVPTLCEEWDNKNYLPLIAYVPQNFNKKIHKKIKAFDLQGNIKWISIDKEPDLPVIIIRPKENIDYTKYKKENLSKLGRVDGAAEFIKSIRTDNINAIETWIRGPRCEIKVVSISSKTKSIISTDFFNPKRSEIKDTWKTENHKLINWRKDEYGTYITMQWFEEDGGGTATTTIAYKHESGITSTLSYSIKENDDDLGQKTVHFDDYINIEYNTGKIKWKMNNSILCPHLGNFDGANCYIGKAPDGTTPFIYNGKFYYSPINGNECPFKPYSTSRFDGANCLVAYIPSDTNPFIWNRRFYLAPY